MLSEQTAESPGSDMAQGKAGVPGQVTEGRRAARWYKPARYPRLLPMAVVAVLVGFLVVVTVVRHPQLSQVDELAHIDYLVRGSQAELLHPDDQLTQEAMRAAACRGADVGTYPPCSSETFAAEAWAWRGYNPGSSHSPYYYLITGLLARVLSAPPGSPELVTWGRLLGIVWFLIGTYLTLRLAELLGLRRMPVVVALVAVAAAPAVLHSSARINPDATAFAGGAAVLLSVVLWEAKRSPLWAVGVASFAAASLDPSNALASMLALTYLAIRCVDSPAARRRAAARRILVGGATLVGAAVAALVVWGVISSSLGSIDRSQSPQERAHHIDSLAADRVIAPPAVYALFPPFANRFWPVETTAALASSLWALTYVTIAALIVLATAVGKHARLPVIGLATTVTLIAGGPLLVLRNYFQNSWYYPISARYGLSLLAGAVLALAWLGGRRAGLVMVGTTGGALYLASLLRLL